MTHQALPSSESSLRELLAGGVRVIGRADVRLSGCTGQWRHVQPGDVFVAITEADTDGHEFASEAAGRGAAAIVCERPLPLFDVPQFIVADSRAAYGQLCQALVGNPSQQIKVIGVAGTHGKSTVAQLLAAIFRAEGAQVGTFASLAHGRSSLCTSNRDGERPTAGQLSPPQLARALSEMVVDGASHAIVEISSRELSQALLAGVTLDAACFTHISRGSLDWHGSVENYRQAERRLTESLSPDGVVILNADDAYSMRVLSDLNQPALTFSLREQAEITAEIIEQHANEQMFVLSAGDESVAVRTEIIGDHHVYNCLTAAATCLAYGIDLTTIARGLEAVSRLPGRMERVMCGQDFAVFVDAARSPDALRAALRAARQVTNGRVICVFGAPGNQERTERPALGRVAGAMADVAILTSATQDNVAPFDALSEVRRGFATPESARVIPNRVDAIAAALREARAGDTVIIAGMGDITYCTRGNEDTQHTDCEVVRDLLHVSQTALSHSHSAA